MIPDVAIPSTKYFCAQKNRINSGIMEQTDMAMTSFHFTASVDASMDNRSPSDKVNFFGELMKINWL